MGARLSQPRGPGGTTESSAPVSAPAPPSPRKPFPRRLTSRTIIAPAAAATMALLLYVYSRTSIRAAKANAQRHREADGGAGLSLVNENRRRHGLAERVDGGGNTVTELAGEVRAQLLGPGKKISERQTGSEPTSPRLPEEEALLRAARRRQKRVSDDG